MKRISLVLLLLMSVTVYLEGQIRITVTTDRSEYLPSDSIIIVVWAHNPSLQPDTLVFSSTCQATCYIDSFDIMSPFGCFTSITTRIVPPTDSVSWTLQYPISPRHHPPLTPGMHSIVGKVIEHGVSDTLFINVTKTMGIGHTGNPAGKFVLHPAYPNPFNPATRIPYSIPARTHAKLEVYDILGRSVATLVDRVVDAGYQETLFPATHLPTGIYVIRLQIGGVIQTQSVALVR